MRLQGRLGNQLFQYAFIHATAKKLKTGFYIDQYIQPSFIEKYFCNVSSTSQLVISRLFDIKGFKNLFSFYLRRLYYRSLEKALNFSVLSYHFTVSPTEIEIKNNTIYQGYFQSESFFKPFEETIKSKFILKKKFADRFINKYGILYQSNTIVTVHIRRTDYLDLSYLNLGADDLTLPVSYYQKAIAKYEKRNVHFVFVSDDRLFVEENFKNVTNKTVSADDEIMDFQHLLNADSCIISNSTFSWWGAWLNSKPGKTVYCPKYYLGYHLKKEVPNNIYPDEWRQIDY